MGAERIPATVIGWDRTEPGSRRANQYSAHIAHGKGLTQGAECSGSRAEQRKPPLAGRESGNRTKLSFCSVFAISKKIPRTNLETDARSGATRAKRKIAPKTP
jgi:hypothetical protein